MNRGKDVRKYGRVDYSLLWGRYIVHQGARLPVMLVSVCVLGLSTVCVFFFALATLLMLVSVLLSRGDGLACLAFLLAAVGLIFSAGLTYGASKLLDGLWGPRGTLLNPDPPPLMNPILPDKKLLVRPSSSSAAQPAELLRAAKETTEEKPEELLRIAEER